MAAEDGATQGETQAIATYGSLFAVCFVWPTKVTIFSFFTQGVVLCDLF